MGRELLLYLGRALCEQFSSDSAITELLSTTEIHLLPSLNTDGYILKTRNNANDKVILTHHKFTIFVPFQDLNRSFPDWAQLGESEEARRENREPETAAVMAWLRSVSCHVHMSLTTYNAAVITTSSCPPVSMMAGLWSSSPGTTRPPAPPQPTR